MNETPRIAVVTGPTATGKTALGVMLAQDLNGEVVSADSMQIYRGMDIGTAKVTEAEMCGIPHHMIDVADPGEDFSVARYVAQAEEYVTDILSRGKLPVIVGGTGLYIDSLISGRSFAGGEPSPELRRELNERFDLLGGEKLLDELQSIDPERASKLHPSDKKRIVRALEVFHSTGMTITQHDIETQKLPPRYDAAVIALSYEDRDELYKRIDQRVDRMLEAGLLDEVKSLLTAGIPQTSTGMQAIGYKEIAAFLRGETSLDEAIDAIKRESRRYAKRQLTWLRRNPYIHWFLWGGGRNFEQARQFSAKFLYDRGLE